MSVGEIFILIGLMMILMVILILLVKAKISSPKVNKWFLVCILSIQGLLFLVWRIFETERNIYYFLFTQTALAIFYVIVDKALKLEDKFIATEEDNSKPNLKATVKTFFGVTIVSFRWIEVIIAFIFPLEIYERVINIKGFAELTDALEMVISIFLFFPIIFDTFSFSMNIKKKFVYLLFSFIIFVGLMSSKWWTGISLLSAIIGMALSEDFFKKNTTLFLKDKFDDSFFKIAIPCTTLIIYVCLIVVQDILPKESVIGLVNCISRSEVDPKSFGGKVAICLLLGFLEIALFSIIWLIIRKTIKRSKVINEYFKKQFFNAEAMIGEAIRKKAVRKTE